MKRVDAESLLYTTYGKALSFVRCSLVVWRIRTCTLKITSLVIYTWKLHFQS